MARQKHFGKTEVPVSDHSTLSGETGGAFEQHFGLPVAPCKPKSTQSVDWTIVAHLLDEIKNYAVETLTNVTAHALRIEKRLDRIEKRQAEVTDVMETGHDEGPDHYTTTAFAKQAVKDGLRGKLSPRTVQKWVREKRLRAEKVNRRGEHKYWLIPAVEYLAFSKLGGRTPPKHEG